MKIVTNPKEALCVDCRKVLRRMLFVCPACNTSRCWHCWDRHLTDKVCAYGRADVIEVAV